MSDRVDNLRPLQDWSHEMKRDWDDRARQDAKWFINPLAFQQTDAEFDDTGASAVKRLLMDDLDLLSPGRDPLSLRVLELGCGIGRMTKSLAAAFGEVYATDVSGEMIRQAQQRLAGQSNVQLFETSGYDFADLPDEYFDLIFSAFVFQHVPSADIISSSLRDAYRTLKTGGAFKFETNSITSFDFEEIEKDTWLGASFPEGEIRRFAEEVDAQIISLNGSGTQYCWTILRKRSPQAERSCASGFPRIEFHGRTDRPESKQVPINGEHSSLTILVSGLVPEAVDCNSVCVDISGLEIWPHYVGPLRNAFAAYAADEVLTRIDLRLPVGAPTGDAEVRLRLSSGETSQPVPVQFVNPEPVIPLIRAIMNGVDLGTDIEARGAKSLLRLHVERLDETADNGNVRVKVGERIVKPSFVGLLPGLGVYRVDAQLPGDIDPGPTQLSLYFGNIESPAVKLVVLAEE